MPVNITLTTQAILGALCIFIVVYVPKDGPLAPQIITLILAIIIAIYSAFVGTCIARLIRYDDRLHPRPKRYTIIPQYKKARQARARDSIESRQSEDFPGASEFYGKEKEDMTEEELKLAEAEEDRISRLPTFVQDDCGDGECFLNVLIADENTEILYVKPKPHPKFRAEPPSYMQMGLRRLEGNDWLRIDNTYQEFHTAKEILLKEKREEVLQVSPIAEQACEELMKEVVDFLVKKFPHFFKIVELEGGKGKKVVNKIVGKEYAMQRPYDVHPLELCARLAMEDFNILIKSEFTGKHFLAASATLFPAGWHMPERIGRSVSELHHPVPLWEKKLSGSVEKYLSRLTSKSSMERSSFFIQIEPPNCPLSTLLFIQEGKDFFPGRSVDIDPSTIIIRHERQTFRRLLFSDAIVFTVKTSLQRLVDVPEEDRQNLLTEIQNWPEQIAEYKGRELWEKAVVGWCLGRDLVIRDDRSVYDVIVEEETTMSNGTDPI